MQRVFHFTGLLPLTCSAESGIARAVPTVEAFTIMSAHPPALTGMPNALGLRINPKTRLLAVGQEDRASHINLKNVLILDGNTRSALAATRSLGQKGLHVVVGEERKWNLSGQSKYCSETFIYPSPSKNPSEFVEAVSAEAKRRGIGVVFPMTEISTALVLKHRKQFEESNIPFVSLETFDTLADKRRLMEIAGQLSVRAPQTQVINNVKALEKLYPTLRFPSVLKPYRSQIFSKGRWISASVKYANSIDELEEIVTERECFREHPFLIQEYIDGRAHGIFALYDRGQPVAFFAHQRLREKPQTGGVSVLSESVRPHPEAFRMAKAILDHVGWHGVAMVEFKVSTSGIPYLMEVNGRFWGSLQLAIDAGVDFPWLLYQVTLGKRVRQEDEYDVGVRSRWLLGDIASVGKAVLGNNSYRNGRSTGKFSPILQFLSSFKKGSRSDVCRWDDFKPFLVELGQFLRR